MVAGLRERDRLRDLFGRHVGEEVARRAVEQNESPSGDERDVAVLFIDLVGSTQLAIVHEPHEVAGCSTTSSRSWSPPSTNATG